MHRRLLVLMAETPVHAGGSESFGAVDLPVQREAATGLPVIWGQSLKGALRQAARDAGDKVVDEEAVFGSRPPRATEDTPADADEDRSLKRGSVSVGDAQLLLFPVAALRNCFAWLTSPLLLERLRRKAALLGVLDAGRLGLRPRQVHATASTEWRGKQVLGPFVAEVDDGGASMAALNATLASIACSAEFAFTRQKLLADVVLTTDTTLASASRMATDIVARVQLNAEAKTVANGPFYSEHLPVETVLMAVLASTNDNHLEQLAGLLHGQPLQLGGDETIGKGVLWCRVLGPDQLREAFTADPASMAPKAEPVSVPAPAPDEQAAPPVARPVPTPAAGRPGPSPVAMPSRRQP